MICNFKICIFIALGLIYSANFSFAQDSALTNNTDEPIEISAQKSLEWLQNSNEYIAKGDVIVTQSDLTLQADNLTANYDNNSGDNLNITRITAIGNIVVKDAGNTALGDKITFDLQTNDIVLTGENIKLITPEQTITANDSLTYNTQSGQAKAVGNAKIKTVKETLQASAITAEFFKNPQTNKQELQKATANKNVKITTDEEIITGNKAIYEAKKNTATITGNVKIQRGVNTLEGNRAVVNLVTNISQIFGDKKSGTRVKGVFFPKSNTQSEQ